MRALAESGAGGREDAMTRGAKALGDTIPAPAAMPGAMDENVTGTLHALLR
jgi:hypothetical protein